MTNDQELKTNDRAFRSSPKRPLALLKDCPVYEPTPLVSLPRLAKELEISSLHVKDESTRMRLGSFKALGGVFAIAQLVCDGSGQEDPLSEKARSHASEIIFVTASAGNHGMSVAAGARLFGSKAIVILPQDASDLFAEKILALGAEVHRGRTYDECVADAIVLAEEKNMTLLADGSWPGYVERPALIMEGYTVLAEECRAQFEAHESWPTHVYLQAGVGGMAAAVAAHIRTEWDKQAHITVVEPEFAPCLKMSIEEGRLVHVDGPVSNMGRLDCKEASLIAFESLRHDADSFTLISDEEAIEALEMWKGYGLKTTPSGAAGLAALIKERPGADSRCLLVMSEGSIDDLNIIKGNLS